MLVTGELILSSVVPRAADNGVSMKNADLNSLNARVDDLPRFDPKDTFGFTVRQIKTVNGVSSLGDDVLNFTTDQRGTFGFFLPLGNYVVVFDANKKHPLFYLDVKWDNTTVPAVKGIVNFAQTVDPNTKKLSENATMINVNIRNTSPFFRVAVNPLDVKPVQPEQVGPVPSFTLSDPKGTQSPTPPPKQIK